MPRERMQQFGQMVLMDSWVDHWLHDIYARQNFIAIMDDATSQVNCWMYDRDTTEVDMRFLTKYIEIHGRPLSISTGKARKYHSARAAGLVGASQAELEELESRHTQLQFLRALNDLDINVIHTYNMVDKARILRFFVSCRKYLLPQLRAEKISDLAEANTFLQEKFVPEWNRGEHSRIRKPELEGSACRPVGKLDLDSILCLHSQIVVSDGNCFELDGTTYLIKGGKSLGNLAGKTITVEKRIRGPVKTAARHNGKSLKIEEKQ
ncbi:MAG: hypothetical protein LBT40_17595 [Deltaproteobacteria bacterium]|nr:hypothetical protein [Deltaproteobacteria bacterium]